MKGTYVDGKELVPDILHFKYSEVDYNLSALYPHLHFIVFGCLSMDTAEYSCYKRTMYAIGRFLVCAFH